MNLRFHLPLVAAAVAAGFFVGRPDAGVASDGSAARDAAVDQFIARLEAQHQPAPAAAAAAPRPGKEGALPPETAGKIDRAEPMIGAALGFVR